MLTLEAAAPVAARPPAWYRAARITISLMPLIAVHVALLAMFEVEITLASVILFFVMTRISGMGITVGFHRYFSHHSFKTSRWFQFLVESRYDNFESALNQSPRFPLCPSARGGYSFL